MKEERIAIIDNGISGKLVSKEIIQSKIFIDDNNKCKEDYVEIQITDFQHGTFCALIVEKYCSGCILNSVRILDNNGNGGIEKIEPALEWCYQNDIKIINLSLGTTNFNECEKLRKMINKYVYRGLFIIAATANSGFLSYPASFTNVIGVATIGSPLSYCKDYLQMGIDTIVPSEHMVKVLNEEIKTSLSNSYAAPYVSALVANRLKEDNTLDIKKLKKYAKEQSRIEMIEGIYEPDWVYKAYVSGRGTASRAKYYFKTVIGEFEKVQEEIDTVIAFSMSDLENLKIENKNLIYLGKEDIHDIDVQGFFWSKESRQRQILENHYQGNGLDVPIVIIAIDDLVDSLYILTALRRAFASGGYNAYTVGMEPECVLYGLEYMPKPTSDYGIWKKFIESQVFYKQSDLVIWCMPIDDKDELLKLYPDYDVEVNFYNNGENMLVQLFIEGERTDKKISGMIDEKDVEEIYYIIEKKLTEDENG